MSNFKEKNIKYSTFCQNVLKQSAIIHGTLDSKHNEIMKEFNKKKLTLPKLKLKLEKLENDLIKIDDNHEIQKQKKYLSKQIHDLEKNINKLNINSNNKDNQIANIIISNNSQNSSKLSNTSSQQYIDYINNINNLQTQLNNLDDIFHKNHSKNQIIDQIAELKEEIEKIDSGEDEMSYFIDTGDILFKYYDNLIAKPKKIEVTGDLQDFFVKIKELKKKNNEDDKYNLFNKYMKITTNTELKKERISQIKICSTCGIEKTLHLQEGFLICTKCGESEYVLIDSDKPNYKDPILENKPNGYKRMNHFSELLNQCQGKESTDISNDVFEKIINELNVLKITDLSKLDNKMMRSILKNLNLNSYYEHIPYIINKLNGIPPPTMSRELEEKVRSMFKEVQEPWINFKGSSRKNFLNNNYVFHKIFELLEEDDFIVYFPYLKSREKLQEHDEIWKKICEHNRWEFITSL